MKPRGILANSTVRHTVLVAAGVLEREGTILAARRKRGSHLEGHWEFPGGKLEPDESPEDCLVRELAEEIGVRVRPQEILEVVFHRYPEKSVLLLFYRCDLLEGEPQPIECDELRWVALADLPSLDWAPADVPFVQRLAETRVRAGTYGPPLL
jgi:8-oxo-dGTP diphosphatase